MRILSMAAGTLLAAAGALSIFMTYAFASMVDPEMPEAARRAEIWHAMTSAGAGGLGFGLVLLAAGVWLAWGGGRKPG